MSLSSTREQGWASHARSAFGQDPEGRGEEDAGGEAAADDDDAGSAGDGREESGAEPNMEVSTYGGT